MSKNFGCLAATGAYPHAGCMARYPLISARCLVGLDRLELSTSPLSGVRSSHLSYRPLSKAGGAGRDRTGDLLNANQALSQLSYSPGLAGLGRPGPPKKM